MQVERLQQHYDIEVAWLPYELHPETPPEGRAIERKPDADSGSTRSLLTEMSAELGINMAPRMSIANSRKALEAAEFARDAGRETFERFHKALFRAYFEEGLDIGQTNVLMRLAAACDIDTDGLLGALDTRAYSQRVDEFIELARDSGLGATPVYIIAGRAVVVGAQTYDVFEQVMERLGVPKRDDGGGDGR